MDVDTSAIDDYFIYGVRPGSYTSYILQGDINSATLVTNLAGYLAIEDLHNYAMSLPPECILSNYGTWKGYISCGNKSMLVDMVLVNPDLRPLAARTIEVTEQHYAIRGRN